MAAHALMATGFAIIGTGGAACSHAETIRRCPGARLVACLSRRSDAAATFAARFDCRAESGLDRLLQDPAIEAVIIANEPTHHHVAIAVARSGRHVLIEKPLAASCDTAIDIVNACREANVTAGVVSQRRFDDGFGALRDALASGVIGTPVFAEFTTLASRPDAYFASGNGWRQSVEGGVTMNLLIHEIDRALALFGGVSSVQATMRPGASTGQPDRRATLMLTCTNGMEVIVKGSSEFSRTWGQALVVRGDRGAVTMEDGDVAVVSNPLGASRPRERARHLVRDVIFRARRRTIASDPRLRQLEDFLSAVRRGAQPSVTIADGLEALRVVKAAHQAAACGRAVLLGADVVS